MWRIHSNLTGRRSWQALLPSKLAATVCLFFKTFRNSLRQTQRSHSPNSLRVTSKMLADVVAALFLSQSLYDDQFENINPYESVASFFNGKPSRQRASIRPGSGCGDDGDGLHLQRVTSRLRGWRTFLHVLSICPFSFCSSPTYLFFSFNVFWASWYSNHLPGPSYAPTSPVEGGLL
jgi:hypothetical protein